MTFITTVPTNFPAGQTRADVTAAITDDSLIEVFPTACVHPQRSHFQESASWTQLTSAVTIIDADGELMINGINCVNGGSICVHESLLQTSLELLVSVISNLYICILSVTYVCYTCTYILYSFEEAGVARKVIHV